eukprot:SAG11_NODE_1731_length_4363_cov_4.183865_5_plen_305_part_00
MAAAVDPSGSPRTALHRYKLFEPLAAHDPTAVGAPLAASAPPQSKLRVARILVNVSPAPERPRCHSGQRTQLRCTPTLRPPSRLVHTARAGAGVCTEESNTAAHLYVALPCVSARPYGLIGVFVAPAQVGEEVNPNQQVMLFKRPSSGGSLRAIEQTQPARVLKPSAPTHRAHLAHLAHLAHRTPIPRLSSAARHMPLADPPPMPPPSDYRIQPGAGTAAAFTAAADGLAPSVSAAAAAAGRRRPTQRELARQIFDTLDTSSNGTLQVVAPQPRVACRYRTAPPQPAQPRSAKPVRQIRRGRRL